MFEKVKEFMVTRKILLIGLVTTALAGAASAEINLSSISEIIEAVVGILPDLIDLVIGVLPIVIVMAIVGFIVAFLDKILGMLKI